MQKYFDNVLGGNTGFGAIAGASVLVKNLNGTTATIFADNGTLTKSNPITTDAAGYFEFYAPDGRYTIEVTAPGFGPVNRQDILLEDPQNASPVVASTLSVSGNATFNGDVIVPATPAGANSAASAAYVSQIAIAVAEKQFVSVKDFGAVGDGVVDDTEAIRAAALAANAANKMLVSDGGLVFFINSVNPAIDIKVSCDFGGSVFKFGPAFSGQLFNIKGDNQLTDITSSVTLTDFKKNYTHIPSLSGFVNGAVKITSNIPNVKRNVTDISTLTKSEINYLTKGGSLAKPLRHDYQLGGTITKVEFLKDEPNGIEISNFGVDVNGRSNLRAFRCTRNDTKFSKIKVFDGANGADLNANILFDPSNCANIVFEDLYGDSFNQSVASSFSYLVGGSYVFNYQFSRVTALAGWGSITCNNINGFHIRDSLIDRFDCHYDSYDVSADHCEFSAKGVQLGSGGGYVRVTNCTKYVNKVTPYDASNNFFRTLLGFRGDYAGYWDGVIHVCNNVIHLDEEVFPATTSEIKAVSFSALGDYGASEALPFGREITVENISVIAPLSFTSSTSGVFVAVDMDDAGLLRTVNGLAYSLSANTVTVTEPGHDVGIGSIVNVSNATGGLPNNTYTVTAATTNTYSFSATAADTTGTASVQRGATILPAEVITRNIGFSTPNAVAATRTQTTPSAEYVRFGSASTNAIVLSSGGNQRGNNAVDMQMVRASRNQIALGDRSFIGSGQNNAANFDDSVVVGGSGNTADEPGAVVVGGSANLSNGSNSFVGAGASNSVSGASSLIVGGSSNTVSGTTAVIVGGQSNVASGAYSMVLGGRLADTKSRYASWASSTNTGGAGRQQYSGMNLFRNTTDATTLRLVANGAGGVANEQFSVASNSVLNFRAMVTARNTANNDVRSWSVTGTIKNTNGTTSLVGTPSISTIAQDAGAEAWTISVTADNTLDVLAIDVTGAAATSIRWHAVVEASEVA